MSDAATPARAHTGLASLRDLTGYQWFVFIVCCLAWDMDCMDQQLFVLARRPAMEALLPKVTREDKRFDEQKQAMIDKAEGKPVTDQQVIASLHNSDVGSFGSWATSVFLIGWSIGGIGFGILGDRWGRVKTLMLTIGLYAAFTGLSAFSQGIWDFYLYRVLTGMGVGGVFAASVTLLAETVPTNSRPFMLGLFQASSVVGNCTAALLFMYFGSLSEKGAFEGRSLLGAFPLEPWRLMFLIGIIPGFLIVIIQFWLREPEAWVRAVAAGGEKRLGSYREMLGGKWRRRAVFGLLLAVAGQIGLWGIGFFASDLQRYVSEPQYKAEAVEKGYATPQEVQANDLPDAATKYITGQKTYWGGITSLVQNVSAFFGIFAFAWITASVGRRPAFAFFFVTAGISTAMVFLFLNSRADIFWMVPVMGFFQLALFGGYAIYFPELFPTRLRSTGTSFCYNVGRFIAASGPAVLGILISPAVFGSYPEPLPFRYAGAAMCSVFGLGLVALLYLPETKGKPLPE
ncbi:MAG TPA: MFS transporter [Fimbriiglobus sp.]|nr:MFS transporter [Fimbriiglobus sp.]